MPANLCKHIKQSYQCKLCFEDLCPSGKPTPGWHQPCKKLLIYCNCKPNEKLREIMIAILTKSKEKYDDSGNDLRSELYTFLLNQLNGNSKSITSDYKFDDLKQIWCDKIMKEQLKSAEFDKKDRLEMCRWLNIIS